VEKVTKKHVGLRVRVEPVGPGQAEGGVAHVEGVSVKMFRVTFEDGERWALYVNTWRVAAVLPPA
jgi:hypothetical protein